MNSDRTMRAMLESGRIAAWAEALDLEAAEVNLAEKPGPQVYVDLMRTTLQFARDVRRIMAERGHERIGVEVVPLVPAPPGEKPA